MPWRLCGKKLIARIKLMKELTPHEEWLGKQIVDIAFHIHKALGPGLLEKVYPRRGLCCLRYYKLYHIFTPNLLYIVILNLTIFGS